MLLERRNIFKKSGRSSALSEDLAGLCHGAVVLCLDGNYTTVLMYFHFLFAVYSKALCHFMDVLTGPMMQSLENRLAHNKDTIRQLELEKEQLTQQAQDDGLISDIKGTTV